MGQFLDDHKDIRQDLQKNPSAANDNKYLDHHKDLKNFFDQNPRLRTEFAENPNYFMHRDDQVRPDQYRQDPRPDVARQEVANFDRFLDNHPEIAEQVRKNPSLLDNREFVQDHPELQTYLQNNPGVREEVRQDPNASVRQEDQFNRRDDARDDRDINRRNLVDFNRFLDDHREIAEQVRRNPSLVDNREFVQNHPALQSYLQNNPDVRVQVRQDPNVFMRDENRFNRTDDARVRDANRDHMASFGEFLQSHERINQDVSRNPALVKDHVYVENHRDLNEYLNNHPEVKQDWAARPNEFVKGAQQPSSNGAGAPGSTATGTPRPIETKPGSAAGGTTPTTNPNGKTGDSAPGHDTNKPKH
jgi:hypothetical protein